MRNLPKFGSLLKNVFRNKFTKISEEIHDQQLRSVLPNTAALPDLSRTSPGAIDPDKKKTRREVRRVSKVRKTGAAARAAAHFCHVRFLWRLAFKRFLRLCLFILRRRFFFRLPMVIIFGERSRCVPASGL